MRTNTELIRVDHTYAYDHAAFIFMLFYTDHVVIYPAKNLQFIKDDYLYKQIRLRL